jgi:integrase
MISVGKATKRSDGRWQVRVSHNGTRKTLYARTRTEALAKAQEYQAIVKAAPAASELRLEAYSIRWLQQLQVRDNTRASYADVMRIRVLPALGRKKLIAISPSDVQAWVDGLALSPRGKQYSHAVLRKALNDALRMELLHRNPALHTVLPKLVKRDVQILTKTQARTLISATGKHEPLCLLALGCGLRISEVLAVRHSSIQDGILSVTESVKHTKGVVTVGPPKTQRSIRRLPVPQHVLDVLVMDNSENFLFGTAEPLSPWTIYSAWTRARVKTGINANFHILRHSYASWLLEANVPAIKVSRLLGHASISTTIDIYGTITTEDVDISALNL